MEINLISDTVTKPSNEMINYMIDSRNKLVEHVFKFTDSTNIHIPVHFKRIINNIHNQLRIQK